MPLFGFSTFEIFSLVYVLNYFFFFNFLSTITSENCQYLYFFFFLKCTSFDIILGCTQLLNCFSLLNSFIYMFKQVSMEGLGTVLCIWLMFNFPSLLLRSGKQSDRFPENGRGPPVVSIYNKFLENQFKSFAQDSNTELRGQRRRVLILSSNSSVIQFYWQVCQHTRGSSVK